MGVAEMTVQYLSFFQFCSAMQAVVWLEKGYLRQQAARRVASKTVGKLPKGAVPPGRDYGSRGNGPPSSVTETRVSLRMARC